MKIVTINKHIPSKTTSLNTFTNYTTMLSSPRVVLFSALLCLKLYFVFVYCVMFTQLRLIWTYICNSFHDRLSYLYFCLNTVQVYVYGFQYIIGNIGFCVANVLSIIVIVPLIHPLKITSAYEVSMLICCCYGN